MTIDLFRHFYYPYFVLFIIIFGVQQAQEVFVQRNHELHDHPGCSF